MGADPPAGPPQARAARARECLCRFALNGAEVRLAVYGDPVACDSLSRALRLLDAPGCVEALLRNLAPPTAVPPAPGAAAESAEPAAVEAAAAGFQPALVFDAFAGGIWESSSQVALRHASRPCALPDYLSTLAGQLRSGNDTARYSWIRHAFELGASDAFCIRSFRDSGTRRALASASTVRTRAEYLGVLASPLVRESPCQGRRGRGGPPNIQRLYFALREPWVSHTRRGYPLSGLARPAVPSDTWTLHVVRNFPTVSELEAYFRGAGCYDGSLPWPPLIQLHN